jgi:hypothetical protein
MKDKWYLFGIKEWAWYVMVITILAALFLLNN